MRSVDLSEQCVAAVEVVVREHRHQNRSFLG
jgi:hypothetical protein